MGTLGYERKALGTGISLHGGSVGQPGVGSSTKDFKRWLKGALEVGCLSLLELCEGNLEGELSCWIPWRIGRKGSGDGCLFPYGPAGEPGRGLIYRGLKRWLKWALRKGRLSLKRVTAEGLEEELLYWGPWAMNGKLWRHASLFVGAPLGNLEWAHLLGTLRYG